MDWLRAKRPDLVPRYEELYRRRAYAPQPERERLARLVRRGERSRIFGRRQAQEQPVRRSSPPEAAGRTGRHASGANPRTGQQSLF